MVSLRELTGEDVSAALPALLLLRPQFGSQEALAEAVARQMGSGYRLLAAFVPGEDLAAAVAGFRILKFLAWGRTLYLDDLSTLTQHRKCGHRRALVERLVELAAEEGCDEFHLDSSVGPHRAAAHRLYHQSGLHVSALHFSRTGGPRRSPPGPARTRARPAADLSPGRRRPSGKGSARTVDSSRKGAA